MMRFKIHRQEQWDLKCWPLLCVHGQTKNVNARLFCVWRWGIEWPSRKNISMLWRDAREARP